MRDSRWPLGTCTAPGRCDSSNSCCSRTSTITGGLVPFPLESRSWTSLGSTSLICSLILGSASAPEAITSEGIAMTAGGSRPRAPVKIGFAVAPPKNVTGAPPEGRPGEDPDLDFLCGSSGADRLPDRSLTNSFGLPAACRYGVETPFLFDGRKPINGQTTHDPPRRLPHRPDCRGQRGAVRTDAAGGQRRLRARPRLQQRALGVHDHRARDRPDALHQPVDAPAPLPAARAPDRRHRVDRPLRALAA